MSRILITNAKLINGMKIQSNSTIVVNDGKIEEIFTGNTNMKDAIKKDDRVIDVHDYVTCAGLIDTHIHGMGGFGTEDMNSDSILKMSESLAEFGITSFIPTLYPNSKEKLFAAEETVANAIGHENGARILGMHIEGPFVSQKKSGALPKNSISAIDTEYFNEILKHGHGHIVCMTTAPELEGIEKLAKRAKDENIVLLAGHTDATYVQMTKAMSLGIKHCTHLFNAMSPLHHREPGAVGAVLTHSDMCCEIIADGVHVHPALVQFVIESKPAENVVLITDSLKPNHQRSGRLFANGNEVTLSANGAFVSKDNPTLLNGSALTLNKALSNLSEWGIPVEKAILMATANPARIYSLHNIGFIQPGCNADISVFDNDFNAKLVLVAGNIVKGQL